jgi:SAM-dependent methyltransferase
MKTERIRRTLSFFSPPLIDKLLAKKNEWRLPRIDDDFAKLSLSGHTLYKLINDYKFETVIDIGSGAGAHAKILNDNKKRVTALDFGTSIYAKEKGENYNGIEHLEVDFYEYKEDRKFDCIWASHVLEHQANPGAFISRCMDLCCDNGIIAITVPPMEEYVLGGHLTNWNAGVLLYNLVVNGIDCSECSILSYGYNISVIVRNKQRDPVNLTYDNGDIKSLMKFLPPCIKTEPFNGRIQRWNW